MLGDSAYALSPWLMNPIPNPGTDAERRYNVAHARRQVTVENAFGTVKMRFPILLTGLRLKTVERSVAVIRACLLSIACASRPEIPDTGSASPQEPSMSWDPPADAAAAGAERRAGLARRNDIVRMFARE